MSHTLDISYLCRKSIIVRHSYRLLPPDIVILYIAFKLNAVN